MTIVEHTGCTSYALIVDGQPVETREQEIALLERLIPVLREHLAAGTIQIRQVIAMFQYDDCKFGEQCDQCGDTPCTTTWNL